MLLRHTDSSELPGHDMAMMRSTPHATRELSLVMSLRSRFSSSFWLRLRLNQRRVVFDTNTFSFTKNYASARARGATR